MDLALSFVVRSADNPQIPVHWVDEDCSYASDHIPGNHGLVFGGLKHEMTRRVTRRVQ